MILNQKKVPTFVLLLLILVGTTSYYPSFRAPFVFDGLRVILKDRDVHIEELSAETLTPLAHKVRPVAVGSFALNYYFGKLDVFGYHLINLIIHVLTAFTFYLFVLTTLNLPSLRDRYAGLSQAIASICALLFVAHPVNTQAVTYIAQRMTCLSVLLFMIALLLYVRGRLSRGSKRICLYTLSVLSLILAMGTKEHVVTLPVFIILYEVYFFDKFDTVKIKKKLGYLLGLLAVPIIIGVSYLPLIMTELKSMAIRQFSLMERLLTELRVIVHYLSLLIFPHYSRLNVDYDFSVSHSLFNPTSTFLSFMFLLGLLILGIYLAKKEPVISFGIIWFFGNLVIESTIIPLELIYEHRLYLPAMGFLLVTVSFGVEKFGLRDTLSLRKKQLFIVVITFIITTLGFWTYQRNLVWQDDFSLWADIVKKSPSSGRAHDNLALANFQRGNYDEAVKLHLKAIQLGGPGLVKKFNNLGNAYFKSGQLDKAIQAYKNAIKVEPDFVEAHNGLGVSYNSKGLYKKAEEELLQVAQLAPKHLGVHSNLALVYANQGLYEKAALEYDRDLRARPANISNFYKKGQLYAKQGLYKKAIIEYTKLVKLGSNDAALYNALGTVYAESKMYREAKDAFLKAVALKNDYFSAHKNLGNIYYLLKQNKKAVDAWEKALAIDPKDKVLAKNLEIIQREMQ